MTEAVPTSPAIRFAHSAGSRGQSEPFSHEPWRTTFSGGNSLAIKSRAEAPEHLLLFGKKQSPLRLEYVRPAPVMRAGGSSLALPAAGSFFGPSFAGGPPARRVEASLSRPLFDLGFWRSARENRSPVVGARGSRGLTGAGFENRCRRSGRPGRRFNWRSFCGARAFVAGTSPCAGPKFSAGRTRRRSSSGGIICSRPVEPVSIASHPA